METPESVDTDESEVDALRQEMHRRLGRCLVRLQQYELVMKAFAARHRVEGAAAAFPEALAAREARFADKTLGQVVGEVVHSVFEDLDLERVPDTPADAPARLAVGFSLALPDDTQAAVKLSLEALVKLRNDLVHGFIERHDIWTTTGLSSAIDYLDTAYTTIDERFIELRDWYRQMANSQQALAEFVASDTGRELLFTSPLVVHLGHAERDLAVDGWTLLDRAIALIRSQEPGLTPRSEGYSSWRQVLHESTRFEIRREAGPTGVRTTWYRSNE